MFNGALSALITPFRDGAVDERALREIVEWQIQSGVDGVVACGSTGESAEGSAWAPYSETRRGSSSAISCQPPAPQPALTWLSRSPEPASAGREGSSFSNRPRASWSME